MMALNTINYDDDLDNPALIDLCINCKYSDCKRVCYDYRQKYREIHGLPPLSESYRPKTKEERKLKPNTLYAAFGEKHTILEWSIITGISADTLRRRIGNGWTPERAFSHKVRGTKDDQQRYITAFGETKPLRQWAAEYHISYMTIFSRLWRGWSEEDAISTPSRKYTKQSTEEEEGGAIP